MEKDNYNDIINALVKKAGGYTVAECIEEYSPDDTLCKKKVTTKHIPPDVSALKVLLQLQSDGKDTAAMSDLELKEEKKRLLMLLKEYDDDQNNKETGVNYED